MSKSVELEHQLNEELEKRIGDKSISTVDDLPVKGSTFIAVILPIIIEVLQTVMNRCNQTPLDAAKAVKAKSPFVKANLRRGINRKRQLKPVRTESMESILAVVDRNDEQTLAEVVQESRDTDMDWDIIGVSDND